MANKKIQVCVTSYPDKEGHSVASRLKDLYHLSDQRYSLVDEPESADIIIIGSMGNDKNGWPYLKEFLNNELINRYPNKCFSISYRDQPIIFNRGIYESGVKSILSFGRVRTGSYTVSGGFNNYIINHHPSEKDYDEKEYLLTFIGRDSHLIRLKVFSLNFNRQDILIEDSSHFSAWGCDDENEKDQGQKYFYNILLRSKFSLCPRGSGTGSIRLFESMKLGVPPVIISDGWILPEGPIWKNFSIIIKEKNINDLEKIVLSYEDSYKEMGVLARQSYENYFAPEVYFNYVVDNCINIIKNQTIPELIYWNLRYPIFYSLRAKQAIVLAKRAIGRLIKRKSA